MPRFDGTGPDGLGPRSGRGCGPCNQDSQNFRTGQGRGYGRGRGFGLRRFCPFQDSQNYTDEQRIQALKNQKKALQEELNAIQEELANIKD